MTMRTILMTALALAWAGCAADSRQRAQDEGELGKLALNLTGTDSHGQKYRLRNAEFDINGYTYYGNQSNFSTTLSSEDDLDGEFLETELVPGQYYIELSNKRWYLERLTDAGPERVDNAVLLSSAYQYAYVYDRGTTNVYFTFGVDGDVIDFRHGKLHIGIIVETPDDDGGVPADGGPTFPPEEDAGAP